MIAAALLIAAFGYVAILLPEQVERGQNRYLAHEPIPLSEEARVLHETLFVADLHADSLLWKRDLLNRSDYGHLDLPRMREGNVALQVFSATTKSPDGQNMERNDADSDRITLLAAAQMWPIRTWGSLFERAVYQLEKLNRLAGRSEVTLLTSSADMREFAARREAGEAIIGALFLIEGAHPLEADLNRLDELFDQGLRIVGLTHFFDNELGGSLHGVGRAGLTDFGRAVVERAGELEMIIDLAHASPAMVSDVLDVSSRPVIVSHGGLNGVCESARNLDDRLMQRIAAGGGLVGIGFFDAVVCDATPDGVVESIRYAIDLLGVENVALGSDYDGSTAVTFDVSELALLTDAMLRAGFSQREIRLVMGDNVKRFLLQNLPGGRIRIR